MKKIWWMMLSLLLLLTGCAAPSQEAKPPTYEQQLSDAMALCRENLPKGQAALRELDARLLGGKQTVGERCTLGLWQMQCGERTVLLWQLTCTVAEEHAGTLDTLRLSWTGGDYHHAEGDGVYSSLQGRDGSSIAFNIQDGDLSAGDTTCGAVYLKSPATAYSARLEHTVDATETVLTAYGDAITATSRGVQQVWTLYLEHKEEAS